jgi:hypothetical protein
MKVYALFCHIDNENDLLGIFSNSEKAYNAAITSIKERSDYEPDDDFYIDILNNLEEVKNKDKDKGFSCFKFHCVPVDIDEHLSYWIAYN